MIHRVALPNRTRHKLTEVVHLQLAILQHAASAGTLCGDSLARFLNTIDMFAGCGERIVEALRRGTTSDGPSRRWGQLEDFASKTQGDEHLRNLTSETLSKEKEEIVRRMRNDVAALAIEGEPSAYLEFYMPDAHRIETLPEGLLAVRGFYQSQLSAGIRGKARYPDWLNAMRDFFISFYEGFDRGFNPDFFADGTKYDRQAFFNSFIEANPMSAVCAICDEHYFQTTYSERHLSEIEHYLPKSIYPHLSCHPFNLIPMCGPCNRIHSDKDPLQLDLQSRRRSLDTIFLPYRDKAVENSAALSATYQDDDPSRPRLAFVQTDRQKSIQSKVYAFGKVYDIPQRWAERSDEIEDRLWRRIYQYMLDDILQADELEKHLLKRKLGRLVAYMHEDLGKDPLAFPILWWLAFRISEELDPVIDGTLPENQSAFVAEILHWVSINEAKMAQLESRTKEIMNTVTIIRDGSVDESPSDN
jgi:hypothetical protein